MPREKKMAVRSLGVSQDEPGDSYNDKSSADGHLCSIQEKFV